MCEKSAMKRSVGIFAYVLCCFALQVAAAEKNAPPANVVLKQFPIKVNQGVAVDAKYLYAISNTTILKCDKETGVTVASWKADKTKDAFKHFTHMNSGTVVDGKLYCAHSRFPEDKNDNSIEVWNVEGTKIKHEKTIRMPREHGSLTWIDRRKDDSWWLCYAVYGKDQNKNTRLVKYRFENGQFAEVKVWTFPEEVRANWGRWSCSGGSWGPDGYLYTTGHDEARAYVLEVDVNDQLKYVRTEEGVGFFGQGIAWDRSSDKPVLWGIVKGKNISATLIPDKEPDRKSIGSKGAFLFLLAPLVTLHTADGPTPVVTVKQNLLNSIPKIQIAAARGPRS